MLGVKYAGPRLTRPKNAFEVAATLEPSAGINLEYLLLALKVRKTAKREPLFSLDPVDPQNLEKTPQKKAGMGASGGNARGTRIPSKGPFPEEGGCKID